MIHSDGDRIGRPANQNTESIRKRGESKLDRANTTAIPNLQTSRDLSGGNGVAADYRALKAGVKPLWGGHRDKAGELYFEPTLMDGATQDMEIIQKEVFGPVLTWQTWRDEDELMKLANGTDYGLAAVIFSKNEEHAMRLARSVVAGTVWVNCFFVRELAAPFGGSRNSGVGREGGNWSFDFYCDVKNIAALKGSFN